MLCWVLRQWGSLEEKVHNFSKMGCDFSIKSKIFIANILKFCVIFSDLTVTSIFKTVLMGEYPQTPWIQHTSAYPGVILHHTTQFSPQEPTYPDNGLAMALCVDYSIDYETTLYC